MAETTSDYNEIVAHFTEETIADRYRFLYDKMLKYIQERKWESYLEINEEILHQAIMDYFADIFRLKEFHNIEHANKSKILAYEIFWILRRKPLEIQRAPQAGEKSEAESRNLAFANEGFAVTLLANEFLAPRGQTPMSEEKEAAFLGLLDHLYYHFKYRLTDKQNLETMLCAFEVGKILGQ